MSHLTRTADNAGSSQPPRPVSLVVVAGPDRGARFELRQGAVVVGTLEGCDFRLTDQTVSRQHLRFEMRRDGLRAIDLGSRNGTFFDGARLQEAVIPVGARIRLGDTELRVDALGLERPTPGDRTELHGLVGASAAMREVIAVLDRAAKSDATILLQGETGTGKEVAARAVHQVSGRTGPLVVFDCGVAAEGVIASELFGHVKGAFTGAVDSRAGAVERAHGGTLFLDEVGELDMALQPQLLRLLETREFRPVGGNATRRVDIRVIAATNRDLYAEVRAGKFREDLLFRLAVVTVTLPPLRERLDDVPFLAKQLLESTGQKPEFSEAALQALRSYAWPGNVRELRNVLLRAAVLGREPDVGSTSGASSSQTPAATEPVVDPDPIPLDYRQARDAMYSRFEREYLLNLLTKSGGNVSQAARSAGVARGHLYRLLKKHDLV